MSSIPNKKLLELINSLYGAAHRQSPEVLSDVFREICATVSSGPGSLSLYSPAAKQYNLLVTTLNEELFEEYNRYYQYVSPFRRHLSRMKSGDRFHRAEYMSDEDFLKTEYYQDYFRKQDAFDFEYRVLFKEGDTLAGVSLTRPAGQANFGAREIGFLDQITPHLEKAFHIYLKFAELKRDHEILSECFEKITQSILVLNKAGKVIYMNGSADRLISSKDGLQTSANGILSANSAQDSKMLGMLLESVFEPDFERHRHFGGSLQIARKSDRRALSVFIAPFSERGATFARTDRLAILLISDPERELAEIEPVLTKFYGLTSAEAKIAKIIAQGKSVSEACDELGIKPNTIRTHLKRIFSKTETTRQTELVKLILNSLNDVKIL